MIVKFVRRNTGGVPIMPPKQPPSILKCVLLSIFLAAISGCGSFGEKPYATGHDRRTVDGADLGYERVSLKATPREIVETIRLRVTPLRLEQRRRYMKYRKRRDFYGRWRTQETRKGETEVASGVPVALSSVYGSLDAKFLGGANATDSDGLVRIRATMRAPFRVFADARLTSVVRHKASIVRFREIHERNMRKSRRGRTGYRLTAGGGGFGRGKWRGVKKRTYESSHATLDVRPLLDLLAMAVREKKTVGVRVVPANFDSRFPVSGASVSLTPAGGVPLDPRKWLRKYVSHAAYLSYAAKRFPRFVRKKTVRTSGRNGAFFRVAPGAYRIEVIHPKYYYLDKVVELGGRRPEIKVLVSELGTKHRVKIISR